MTRPKNITVIFFLLAIAIYFIAPQIALGLAIIGLLFEAAGWISLFKDHKRSTEKES